MVSYLDEKFIGFSNRHPCENKDDETLEDVGENLILEAYKEFGFQLFGLHDKKFGFTEKVWHYYFNERKTICEIISKIEDEIKKGSILNTDGVLVLNRDHWDEFNVDGSLCELGCACMDNEIGLILDGWNYACDNNLNGLSVENKIDEHSITKCQTNLEMRHFLQSLPVNFLMIALEFCLVGGSSNDMVKQIEFHPESKDCDFDIFGVRGYKCLNECYNSLIKKNE